MAGSMLPRYGLVRRVRANDLLPFSPESFSEEISCVPARTLAVRRKSFRGADSRHEAQPNRGCSDGGGERARRSDRRCRGVCDASKLIHVLPLMHTVPRMRIALLIQNTQNRDSRVLQLKLDELIRSTSGARNQLINLESLGDERLDAPENQFKRIHEERGRSAR